MEVNMFRIEHDTTTGEVKEIPLTAAEIKAIEKSQKEAAKNREISEAEAEAKAAAKQVILDRIGLTADELKTILG
jgi:hypothetical protein